MAKSILSVDDAPSILGLISMVLTNDGYKVTTASSAMEALKLLETEKYHLIISDVNMPEMSGIEMVTKIKSDPKHKFTPVVMLTTESSNEKKEEGKTAGVKAWMVKPFKPETLLSVVKKILG